LLGGVDALAEGLFLVGRERTQLLQLRSQFSGLAEIFGLGVFERRRLAGGSELREGATNYFV